MGPDSLRTSHHARRRRRQAAALTTAVGLLAALAATTSSAGTATAQTSRHGGHGDKAAGAFRQVNLVSDVPGRAQLLDPEVKNPWGIAFGPTTPLWVNNQFNPASNCNCIPAPEDLLTKITLYQGANGTDPISKVPLEVTASSPTGMVFNPTSDFVINQDGTRTPARFLFNETVVNPAGDNGEGLITGWSNLPAPVTHTTRTAAVSDPGFPSGLALVPARGPSGPRLLVADGASGKIQVYGHRFHRIHNPGLFVDPNARRQHRDAYNVMVLNDRVYVTYFGDDGGAVSVFSKNGTFRKRLITGGRLDAPWGLAIAPPHWGRLGGALLVGNVDDGRINAYNLKTGKFRGTLANAAGHALVNPGLWGIAFGNGVIGTPRTLIFAAGIGSEVGGFGDDIYEHGLIGLIRPTG